MVCAPQAATCRGPCAGSAAHDAPDRRRCVLAGRFVTAAPSTSPLNARRSPWQLLELRRAARLAQPARSRPRARAGDEASAHSAPPQSHPAAACHVASATRLRPWGRERVGDSRAALSTTPTPRPPAALPAHGRRRPPGPPPGGRGVPESAARGEAVIHMASTYRGEAHGGARTRGAVIRRRGVGVTSGKGGAAQATRALLAPRDGLFACPRPRVLAAAVRAATPPARVVRQPRQHVQRAGPAAVHCAYCDTPANATASQTCAPRATREDASAPHAPQRAGRSRARRPRHEAPHHARRSGGPCSLACCPGWSRSSRSASPFTA